MLSSIPHHNIASDKINGKIPFTTSGTVLLHIDFLLTGIVMTFLGPMLPILAARWSLNDSAAGALIFAQFLSSMFGMLVSGILVERQGYRVTLILGSILMALGMALLGSGPYWSGILSVCILGLGHGITTPAGNLRTAEVDASRSASALNVINAVWGIGAMSSPFLLAAAQKVQRPELFLYGTSIGLILLLLCLALSRFSPDTRMHISQSQAAVTASSLPMLLLICGLFFIYVGTETSCGGWVATYAHRMSPGESTLWALTPSFFWGSLLAGRTLAAVALRFKPATTIAKIGLTLALIGGVALVSAHNIETVMAAAVLAGLGLASIFPISVSLLPVWFGDSARRASGAVFGSGNMGGAALPWVVGAVSTHFGGLRAGFTVPLLGVAIMFAFYFSSAVSRQAQAVIEPERSVV
ncbi:MAG TPA: MFS transporter [Terriglobales bacterium]|nr:MFS transporter [Terriglobales bacterium]